MHFSSTSPYGIVRTSNILLTVIVIIEILILFLILKRMCLFFPSSFKLAIRIWYITSQIKKFLFFSLPSKDNILDRIYQMCLSAILR